jgi:cysteine synthase A
MPKTSGRKPRRTRGRRDITTLIGSTPLLKLNSLSGAGKANIFAKIEFTNPGGSIKDRIALSMITDAEKSGLLKPGGTIVEPTTGNTGIGLAMVGAAKGYRVILVAPEGISELRRRLLTFWGAEVVFSSKEWGMRGAIDMAHEMVISNSGYFMPQQFNNRSNPEAHRRTTAVELIKSMGGNSVDCFVAGVGTGGTITGVGEVLKGKYQDVTVVAVEPNKSAVLSGSPPGSHGIQGIGPGFIPRVLNVNIIDKVLPVDEPDAYNTASYLAREEGLLVGISSGAACHAAQQMAEELGRGKNVVVIFPDGGERNLCMNAFPSPDDGDP